MTATIQRLPAPERPSATRSTLPLDFARETFAHTQELIRVMDQKAFYVMNAVGLLTTGLGVLTSVVLAVGPGSAWRSAYGLVVGVAAVVYLALAIFVVFTASAVFRAAGSGTREVYGPALLFPLLINAQHGTDAPAYHRQLAAIDEDEALADYADSITAMADIYAAKQRRVNRSIAALRWLGCIWLVMILLLLYRAALP